MISFFRICVKDLKAKMAASDVSNFKSSVSKVD